MLKSRALNRVENFHPLRGTIAISDEEILEAKWFSDPPENVLDFVREQVAEWESDN